MTDETGVVEYARPADSAYEQWARDAYQIAQVATNLSRTAFVPSSFGKDPAAVTAAILTGKEIGLQPMAALRSIDIVNGVPAMRAVLLRALVQSAGHEIWTEESTATRAIVCGRRKGSERTERVVWDMDRASKQQLVAKDNWKRMPTDMLLARATSALVRLIAADLVLGIPYSTEELQDGVTAENAAGDQQVAVEAPRRRTARRAALPAAVEPELPPVEEAPAEPASDSPPAESEEPPVEEPELEVARPFEDDPSGLTAEELAELEQVQQSRRRKP